LPLEVEFKTITMNLGSMRKIMIKSAKEKLALHKNLGQRSSLSVLQVAELLDFVTGNSETAPKHPAIFFDNGFSLN
jgi:hypothetical protein